MGSKEIPMIVHRTFSRPSGVTPRGMNKGQVSARSEAEAFIARELKDDQVISITESAVVTTWSRCLVSVTIWYRK
jgi:hypothetical protein